LLEKVNTYQIIINSLFYFIFICLFISWTSSFICTNKDISGTWKETRNIAKVK